MRGGIKEERVDRIEKKRSISVKEIGGSEVGVNKTAICAGPRRAGVEKHVKEKRDTFKVVKWLNGNQRE